MIGDSIRVVSWNLNGGVVDKMPLLEGLLCYNDVLCVQEHFLSNQAVSLLELNDGVKVFATPAKSSGRGRPSGGIAILVSSRLNPILYKSSDFFVAVKVHKTVIHSVYMPTDYRDSKSEKKFSEACSKLSSSVGSCSSQGLVCIVAGDVNCDLTDESNARAQILLSSCDGLRLANNDLCFTYIHNSGSTSSLDFMLSSIQSPACGNSHVDLSVSASDHFPIINTFRVIPASPNPPTNEKKWKIKTNWSKIDLATYHYVLDEILTKIKVPFQLLQQSVCIQDEEKQLLLNIYCSEISHALLSAEAAAVPIRKVRVGTEIPKWSENPALSEACGRAKFWLRLWNECGRPKSGVVNEVRLFSKRRFAKILSKHKCEVIDQHSQLISNDPNAVWRFLKRNGDQNSVEPVISEQDWVSHFTSEFSPPEQDLEDKYEVELDKFMELPSSGVGYIVTVPNLIRAISKLKKKQSKGVDKLCGLHLVHGTAGLLSHLELLFQIIFNSGLVPDVFGTGVITPILKKGKNPSECVSYRPITVSPVLCKLMELLVIDHIAFQCSTPDNQFGFKKGVGREHVHYILANILIEADELNESLILASHDVRRAFDSGIHPQLLVSAHKRGVDRSVILPFRDMYKKLRVQVKVPSPNGPIVLPKAIPVRKGIRQGAISSPRLYNNSVLEAQKLVQMSCIFRGLDVTLLNYADDIFNLSRCLSRIEENFQILDDAYREIGLSFNASKSEIVAFNRRNADCIDLAVKFGAQEVPLSDSIMYLGMPIGHNMASTRARQISNFAEKARKAYGALSSTKAKYNRQIRARLYNALVIPHFLALSPFWHIFSVSDKRNLRSLFYKYAKFLLNTPPWVKNSKMSARFGITDPIAAVTKRRSEFLGSLGPSSLAIAIRP